MIVNNFIDYSTYNKPSISRIIKVENHYIINTYTIEQHRELATYKCGGKQLTHLLIHIIYESKLIIDNLIKDRESLLPGIKCELEWHLKKHDVYLQTLNSNQFILQLSNGNKKAKTIIGIASRYSDVISELKTLKLNKVKNNLSVIKQIKFRRINKCKN